MAKTIASKTPAQVKSELARLKKAGLYSGDLRKSPTDYAKRLTRKYADVLNGRASVVKITRHSSGDTKGVAEARETAKRLAREYSDIMTAKGERVIVKQARSSEKLFYSKDYDSIIAKVTDWRGDVYHRYVRNAGIKIVKNDKSGEYEYKPVNIPELGKNNESYALPFYRGPNRPLEYHYSVDWQEILSLALKYESKSDRRYSNATSHIMIVTRGKLPKPPKRGENVVDFPRKPKTKRKKKA